MNIDSQSRMTVVEGCSARIDGSHIDEVTLYSGTIGEWVHHGGSHARSGEIFPG
jgi:hypothetical protein